VIAISLNAMVGKGVHLVTVNDYLAKRDAEEMGKLYEFLGYTTGCITAEIYDDASRKAQYSADITYGTNNEFGFDYLRDNMKTNQEEKVQRDHFYAIVDEVDSILIDEARTPLIISGPTNRDQNHYAKANEVALQLEKGKELPVKPGEDKKTTGDFVVDEKNKQVVLTEQGLQKAEELFDAGNLYDLENAILAHHLDQALKANYLFEKDVDYVIRDGEIIIVDEFTGRLSEGRRYSEGLHQALEAKEGVEIKEESQTLAEVTYQNYFRQYTEDEKLDAVVSRIKELNSKGQPVLIGTASIEKSELIHEKLKKEKIPHNVLNAKNHEQEAEIIVNAGQKGAVTVATNMAGRGVDIKIDDEVRELGGLVILGTERHESRRIDNQLRGRAGRQGDPGESQFFLSLDDNLLRIFGGEKIRNIMNRIGVKKGEFIDSKLVTRSVENAQKKVESLHYESRKHLLEYDDVANFQRKAIYKFRDQLIDTEYDIASKIKENRAEVIEYLLQENDIIDGLPTEDFDLDALIKDIAEISGIELPKEILEGKEPSEIKEEVLKILEELYEEKMSMFDDAQRKEVEKLIYLQTLDNLWRDHLYEMDTLKTGIGLRGYNQKDPLTEYKQESYKLFEDLIIKIKKESIKFIHRVEFNFEEPTEQEQSAIETEQKESPTSNEIPKNSQTEISSKKVKRNDPCPCGSGKKYKNCCGKSGPKKGLLA